MSNIRVKIRDVYFLRRTWPEPSTFFYTTFVIIAIVPDPDSGYFRLRRAFGSHSRRSGAQSIRDGMNGNRSRPTADVPLSFRTRHTNRTNGLRSSFRVRASDGPRTFAPRATQPKSREYGLY